MALTEETKNDKIEIIDKGDWTVVQVRKATIIKKDGVEISRTFHRHIITPIQSISVKMLMFKPFAMPRLVTQCEQLTPQLTLKQKGDQRDREKNKRHHDQRSGIHRRSAYRPAEGHHQPCARLGAQNSLSAV